MARAMQLPGLYLRGSISAQTMAGLSCEEVSVINGIVGQVANSCDLAADKNEFTKQLSLTIGGDYKDYEAAEAEFFIAIWRATIYLLHHRNYTYICSVCGATEYDTISGKRRAIDQQFKICPACNKAMYNRNIVSIKEECGQYSILLNNSAIISNPSKKEICNILTSPINPIYGSKNIEDPQKILNDASQRNKWYTVWIWNYFRQILNENAIITHGLQQCSVSGLADRIAYDVIVNQLIKEKYKFYVDMAAVDSCKYEICLNIYSTKPEFSYFLMSMIKEYKAYGVDIIVDDTCIQVKGHEDMPIIDAVISIDSEVNTISIDGPTSTNIDYNDDNWGDAVESNVVNFEEHDGIEDYVSNEVMNCVRNHLPDDKTKAVFDILSQSGKNWVEFSRLWGGTVPSKAHMAKFLGVSMDAIDVYKGIIADQCIANDMVNGDVNIHAR